MAIIDANTFSDKGFKVYNPNFDSGFEDADTGSLPIGSLDHQRPTTEPVESDFLL